MNNSNHSKNVNNDILTKNLLNFKSILAYLLKHLDPIFEEMSIEEIIQNCLDPFNSDPVFMTPLSGEEHQPGQNDFRRDRVFRIKYPKSSLNFPNQEFLLIINPEVQGYKPNGYELENRGIYYTLQQFINENQILNFYSAEESYSKKIPVWGIWLIGYSDKKSNYITHYKLDKFIQDGNRNNGLLKENNYFPDINIDFIYTNREEIPGEDEIFKITRKLNRIKTEKDFIDFFEEFNLRKETKGDIGMIFTQFEQNFLDQGRKEGLDQGRKEGLKEGIETGRDEKEEEIIMNMIDNGVTPEQISKMTNISTDKILQVYNKLNKMVL